MIGDNGNGDILLTGIPVPREFVYGKPIQIADESKNYGRGNIMCLQGFNQQI